MTNKQIEQTEIEAPYELPEGWKWCRLGDVAETLTGSTPSKKNPEFYGDDFPFFKPADLDQGLSLFNASEYLSEEGKKVSRFIPKNSTLICCIGSIGKSAYLLRDGTANQQINAVIPNHTIDSKYIYYSVNTENFINQLWENSSSTTISIINKSKMDNCIIPIPPTLEEQQRIVNRIETMFAKLDQAKEKAQNVVDTFETRKASILHKAFTGELTKKWREENGVGDDSWEEKKLEEISLKITDGEHSTPRRVDYFCGYYLLSARNIHNGEIRLDDVDYVEESEYERIRKRCNPDKNDILISCSGSVGRVCVIQDDNKYVMVRSAAMIKIKECNSFFIAYMLQTFNVQQQIEKTKKQSCQANLFLGAIKELIVPVPTLPEQTEIVRILDVILEKETKAKESAEAVLEQIDLLKKSILARAFRGKI